MRAWPGADRCVLQGPPGAGKSTAGRAAAQHLGWAFVDLDAAVEREAGATVREVFAREGEGGFRARERRALGDALKRDRVVIAAGGGALVDDVVRRTALREATVVTLRAPRDVLAQRLAADDARPLLGEAGALERLLAARASSYAECHATVDAAGHPDAVAAAVVAAVHAPRAVVVPLGERTYPVLFAPFEAAMARLGTAPSVLVTDTNVARCWAASALAAFGGAPEAVVLRAGEGSKTLRSVARVWNSAGRAGADRGTIVASLGGGVVSDVAGFAAATWLRGVRHAVLPTSLLAMADAAVGGKTAVDLARGKNLVGAVHQPSVVCVHVPVLRTLPTRHRRAGLAEVAKIAAALDAGLFAWLEAHARALAAWAGGRDLDEATLTTMIAGAVAAKADVVARDELERGDRALLNFGHTLGHALEAASGFRALHGDCVAAGMRGELALGVARGVTAGELRRRVCALLDDLGLPHTVRADPEAARSALRYDKKSRAGAARVVLLTDLGASALHEVPAPELIDALTAVLEIRDVPIR